MSRGSFIVGICCVAMLLVSGCEESASSSPSAKSPSQGGPPTPAIQRPPRQQQEAPPATRQEVADVGAGKKGHGYGGGIITEPLRLRWRVEERIIFQIKIPHALQLYEAEHEKKPQSHEEFMKAIIEAIDISLPELPAGHEYKYDPEQGQLMVEMPNVEVAE